MELVTAYKASDGTLFGSENECQEHEFSLAWRERINEFMESDMNEYRSGAHNSMARKIILSWERFKTGA